MSNTINMLEARSNHPDQAVDGAMYYNTEEERIFIHANNDWVGLLSGSLEGHLIKIKRNLRDLTLSTILDETDEK